MKSLEETYKLLHKSGLAEMETMTHRHCQKRFEEMKQSFAELQRKAEAHHNQMMAHELKAETGRLRDNLEELLATELDKVSAATATSTRHLRESIMNELEGLVLPVVAQYCQSAIVASSG